MTGDGVNDVGALKQADVGLAMGSGSDVTKAVADIVLLDDRFATIVDAVCEGRRIYGNLQKLIAFLLASNFVDVAAFLLTMVLGLPVPLEQSQLLKADLITRMFYSWCLIWEPAGWFNMMIPPRNRRKPILDRLTRNFLVPVAIIAYILCLLLAMVASSWLYLGVISQEQLATDSINSFYDESNHIPCLYANTLELQHQEDGSDKLVYHRDTAPIYCRIAKRTLLEWTTHEEWGRERKQTQRDAIVDPSGDFSWWTGTWGDRFSLEQSFFARQFQWWCSDF
jgi:hypothetical protein